METLWSTCPRCGARDQCFVGRCYQDWLFTQEALETNSREGEIETPSDLTHSALESNSRGGGMESRPRQQTPVTAPAGVNVHSADRSRPGTE